MFNAFKTSHENGNIFILDEFSPIVMLWLIEFGNNAKGEEGVEGVKGYCDNLSSDLWEIA